MEYINVHVSGKILPQPRFNHCSYVNGSEIIICGGQGLKFKHIKSIVTIELDQSIVDKNNPYLQKFKSGFQNLHNKAILSSRKPSVSPRGGSTSIYSFNKSPKAK
jgi:hypothetical protein